MKRLQRNTLMYADITRGHSFAEDEDLTPEERVDELREARWFKGLFSYAGVNVLSDLFSDVVSLRTRGELGVAATRQLSRLPEVFREQYTPMIAQAFLCSVVSVTQKFAQGWTRAASLAEELAVKLILEEAETLRQQAGIELEFFVVEDGYDFLLEDTDFLWLYENKAGYLGSAASRVSSWFVPFDEERPTAPYARPDLD